MFNAVPQSIGSVKYEVMLFLATKSRDSFDFGGRCWYRRNRLLFLNLFSRRRRRYKYMCNLCMLYMCTKRRGSLILRFPCRQSEWIDIEQITAHTDPDDKEFENLPFTYAFLCCSILLCFVNFLCCHTIQSAGRDPALSEMININSSYYIHFRYNTSPVYKFKKRTK